MKRSEAMSSTVRAIYENGVFRPIEPVDLADHTRVELELRVPTEETATRTPLPEGLKKVYSILGERYNSGYTDTSARHDEHQPSMPCSSTPWV
jgi:predicted DNA-binding antitoxin AbrB/MazE fold protein